MLKKTERLDRKAIKEVLEKGKSVFLPPLSLRFVADEKEKKFAFVVPNAVAKSAVMRNKIKRRARHIIKKNMETLKPDFSAIVFFKHGSEKMSFSEMENKMKELLIKSKLIKY